MSAGVIERIPGERDKRRDSAGIICKFPVKKTGNHDRKAEEKRRPYRQCFCTEKYPMMLSESAYLLLCRGGLPSVPVALQQE